MPVQKFFLYIQPGAKTTAAAGYFDGKLRIKIKSPARDNKANAELIAFLAEKLGLPKSALEITRGLTGRHKVISIETKLSAAAITAKISGSPQ
ncbi:MAG: DUF167 domain-containing protein [Candidatus Margulisbacteria bacterium]|jgi:uncharacterized protein (TIGR00251 family)|nr:DUF167 domain-containing protein [Candidatus Margulisiibacteriota bacterium]